MSLWYFLLKWQITIMLQQWHNIALLQAIIVYGIIIKGQLWTDKQRVWHLQTEDLQDKETMH